MDFNNQVVDRFNNIISRPGSRLSGRALFSPSQQRHVGFETISSPTPQQGFQQYEPPSSSPTVYRPQPILPTLGHVLKPNQPLRQRVHLQGRVDPVVQYAQAMNLDPTMAGIALGFSQAHRKASREARAADFEIKAINPFSHKTNLGSFDFNIHGQTAQEILGAQFANTFFESEGARLATMKSIFQRVVDDPRCSDRARTICLDMLGRFDPPREYTNNMLMSTINTMGALAGSVQPPQDENVVEPPILGTLMMSDPAITKELFFLIGVPLGEKYKAGGKRSLRFYLRGVATKITMMKLCSESAYSLLLTILEGDLHEEVHRLKNRGAPFHETWRYIQKCASSQTSVDELMTELTALYKTKPQSIFAVLSRIQEIRIQQFSTVPNKIERENTANVITRFDFKNLIEQFYGPTVMAAIETLHNQKVAIQIKEKQLCEMQGLPYQSSFDQVQCLKETACEYINQMVRPAKGPSMIFASSMDIHHPPDMASMSISSLSAHSNTGASGPLTSHQSISSHQSAGASQVASNGSTKGSRKSGSINGRNNKNSSAQHPLNQNHPGLQAAIQAKQALSQNAMRAKNQYDASSQSGYPPPDFTKLLLPLERSMARRDTSIIPSVCWERIGTGICFLCAVRNHFFDECPLYPGQKPIEKQCSCHGFHQSECRQHLRNLMDHCVKEGGWTPPPLPPSRPPKEGYNNGDIQYASRPNGNGGGGRNAPYPPRRNGNGNGNGNNNGYNHNRNPGNRDRYNNDRNGRGRQDNRYPDRRGNRNNDRRFDRRDDGQGQRGASPNNFGYPNQTGDFMSGAPYDANTSTANGAAPGGQTTNHRGGGLGNSGSQAVPSSIQMNPLQGQTPQPSN